MSTILVIDDSAVQIELMVNALKSSGYSVDTENNGSRAIERANGKKYELILLDIHMPRTNGLAVLDEIRAGGASSAAKVIIVSSDHSPRTIDSAKLLGACDYIVKPIKTGTLLSKVVRWIDRRTVKDEKNTPRAKEDERRDNVGESKILIVDDSKVQLEFMASALQRSGYMSERVTNGSRAIKMAQSYEYELILLDIHMPRTNGLVVLDEIRSKGASIDSKIVIISSDKTANTVETAKALGAWDYLIKPFSAQKLLNKVGIWIGPGEKNMDSKLDFDHMEAEKDLGETDSYEEAQDVGAKMKGIRGQTRILVVEDSKVTKELIYNVLSKKGYRVDAEEDGAKAIRRAKRTKYDLLLLDIHMPKTNGLAVLNEIRTAGKSVEAKVIIVSSDNSPITVRATRLLGANDYIIKPFRVDTLVEKVENITS